MMFSKSSLCTVSLSLLMAGGFARAETSDSSLHPPPKASFDVVDDVAPKATHIDDIENFPLNFFENLQSHLRGGVDSRNLQDGTLGEGESCQICDTDDCAAGLSCRGSGICTCGLTCGTGTCQPAPTPRPTQPPNVIRDGCFSASATVQTANKGIVAMKDLVVGDKVLTDAKTRKFEEVYAFGHWNPTAKETFLQIHHACTAAAAAAAAGTPTPTRRPPLEMTSDHMLFVNGRFVKAGSVEIGDTLQDSEGLPSTVTKIRLLHRQDGVYAPLTSSGTLVVDDVVVSTYISLNDKGDGEYPVFASDVPVPISQQFGIHMILSPYRMLCIGLKMDGFCHSKTTEGISSCVSAGMQLAKYADASLSLGMQIVLLILAVVLIVPLYLVEALVGPRCAPILIFVLGVIGGNWWKAKQSRKHKSL